MENRKSTAVSKNRHVQANTRGHMSTVYKWHEAYKAALLETEWLKIEERIRAAEAAIEDRKRELAQNGGGTPEENDAIAGAVRSMSVLRTEAASWSARESQEAS